MPKSKPSQRATGQVKQPRAKIPEDVRNEVVLRCKRHCCMCYGLYGKREVIEGQLAHLGRDPSTFSVEDLAYLCLECHKKYDTKNNRTVSYTADEVRTYR